MSGIGRNDPCPCGSGKKYKRCCSAAFEAEERQIGTELVGAAQAIEWLFEHHGEVVDAAIAIHFFGIDDPDELSAFLEELPRDLRGWIVTNLNEWLLADAELEIAGVVCPAAELVLGPGGPPLSPEGRAYITELAVRPLTLYEMVEILPGKGLWVRDALAAEAPSLWVHDPGVDLDLMSLRVLGARLLPHRDGWRTGASFYPLPGHEVEEVRRMVREHPLAANPRFARRIVSQTIIDISVGSLLEGADDGEDPEGSDGELPQLLHAGSGDPMLFVTDHYRVDDWQGLAAALATAADVEGDRDQGWVRLDEASGGIGQRILLALNVHPGDRLQAVAYSLSLADAGRDWLRQLAGTTVTFRTREIVDPLSVLRAGDGAGSRRRPAESEIPPGDRTELRQLLFEHLYAAWADEPLPALENKTPRQAKRTKRGREQVIDLLKLYEHEELEDAAAEGREPASLQFLWDELKLDRDRHLE